MKQTFLVEMNNLPGRAADVMGGAGDHIQWVLSKIPEGWFLAGGALLNDRGEFEDGLCIMQADSAEQLKAMLDEDPFVRDGIRTYTIRAYALMLDEKGYKHDFPAELGEAWGIDPQVTKHRLP